MSRKRPEDTACPHRTTLFWVIISGDWMGYPITSYIVGLWACVILEEVSHSLLSCYGQAKSYCNHTHAHSNN